MSRKLSLVSNVTYESCGNSDALTRLLSKRVDSLVIPILSDIVASCRSKCGDVKDECWYLYFNDDGKLVPKAVKSDK